VDHGLCVRAFALLHHNDERNARLEKLILAANANWRSTRKASTMA
jgi:hypothetical protein